MYIKGAAGEGTVPLAGESSSKTLNTEGGTERGLQDSRMECDPGVSVAHRREDSGSEQNTGTNVEPSVVDDTCTAVEAGGGSQRDGL